MAEPTITSWLVEGEDSTDSTGGVFCEVVTIEDLCGESVASEVARVIEAAQLKLGERHVIYRIDEVRRLGEAEQRGSGPATVQGELIALPPVSGTGCRRCGQTGTRVAWHEGKGVKHLRESCARCGAYLRWLPQTEENIARAEETKA